MTWHGEKFRHSYASRGISTYNKPIYRGTDFLTEKDGKFYAEDILKAKFFGKYIKKRYLSKDTKIFDINNQKHFNLLLNNIKNKKIIFNYDNSIFESYKDFLNHDDGIVIAESNNSWIIEKYEQDIKQLGYDAIKFMDGGDVSYLILNFDKIKR